MILLPTPVAGAIALLQTAVLLVVFSEVIDSDAALYNAALIHIALAVITLLSVTVFHAPYGRYSADTMVPIVVNTRAAWILQEMPTLVAVLFHFARNGILQQPITLEAMCQDPQWIVDAVVRGLDSTPLPALFALSLFVCHYIHRTFIFPFRIQPRSPTPIHVMLLANLYCCFNGTLQASAWIRFTRGVDVGGVATPWLMGAGVAVFACGMLINIKSDYALIALRKASSGRRSSGFGGGYSIPRGFAFEYVSCPNFLGEGVEWLGYTITALGSAGLVNAPGLVAMSFFLYTLSNTFPRGVKHHQWYLDTFKGEYASLHRKAVIPWVL
jgi:3-oxo-5-alpha-steroid 4-dehydrogenase 1